MRDLATLTVGDFTAGDTFTLADGATFTLTAATALPESPGAPRAPFALTFAEASDSVRPQGIVALTHPALGTLELFVVPLGRDGDSVRYEAIFA